MLPERGHNGSASANAESRVALESGELSFDGSQGKPTSVEGPV